MPTNIDYSNYVYYPLVRVRQAEMQGVEMLEEHEKDSILPMFTIGKWRNTDGVDKGLERITKAFGQRPYMLDLSKDLSHQNEFVQSLLNPDGDFKAWTSFISTHSNVVPLVQITGNATTRNIVRQALALENAGCQPVFRIRDYKVDTDAVISSLTAMDAPERSLIVIDAGYLRELSTLRIKPGVVQSILQSINRINSEVDTQIVVAGTSYPRAVTDFLNEGDTTRGRIDMIEWDLFGELSDYVLYGDHAGIHSVVYDDAGGTFLPKLDYPKDGFWNFERRPDIRNAEGFASAAVTLIEQFPAIASESCWGAKMIMQTAKLESGATINTPSTALAVRVNLHISHQIKAMTDYYSVPEEDEGEEEWE